MIFTAKIIFLFVTVFWCTGALLLVVFHQETSVNVTLAVLAIATGCIGTITTWKFFRRQQ